MSPNLTIGLAQYDIAWEKPEVNMVKLDHWLKDLAGYDLMVLPEMWPTGFTMDTRLAETHPGPALQWMTEKAAAGRMHIAGSLPVCSERYYYNRFYAVSPDGETNVYDKRHLFSYGKEDRYYERGNQRTIFRVNEWRIMPIICYDLRFPVWCRYRNDYDVLLVVANWPAARIHHWDALLRARAIENQCYVVAVNRVGTDGNQLVYPGHSCVIDMNGQDIGSLPDHQESLGKVTLDRSALEEFRNQYRFLQDRDSFSL